MPKAVNIAGQQFGKLKALTPTSQRTANGSRVWTCECECGNTCEKSQQALVSGHVKSCGCARYVKVTGSRAKVIAELENWIAVPKSIPDICKATKLSWLTVRDVIRKLHHEGKVHIVSWSSVSTPEWGLILPTSTIIDDAPKPEPMPVRERVRKHRQKAKLARDAEQGVPVQVEIETPSAAPAEDESEPEAPAWWEHIKE